MDKSSKYTLGTWKVKAQLDTKCTVFQGRNTDTAYFLETEGYQDLSETLFNANLMQCAPELLEACKFVENFIRLKMLNENTSKYASMLRDAIAKAEGK